MSHCLVLLRHGQTEWVRQNRFAGWADAPLSAAGRREARRAGQALAEAGLLFDQSYCSRLSRARETLAIVKTALRRPELPTTESWRLNERHYGRLQGMNRIKAAVEFGNDQVASWRRDYRAGPPEIASESPDHPSNDPLYGDVDPSLLPGGESLEEAAVRVQPWWESEAVPSLLAGKTPLVVAHTASLRGLARIIEGLSDRETEAFRIATALPLVLFLEADLTLARKVELTSGVTSQLRQFLTKIKPRRRISWI